MRNTIKQVVEEKQFGEVHEVTSEILKGILEGNDPYLIGVDFKDYIGA